ncbi:MAG: DoxX family protein [Methylotenera sp.]
MKYVLIKLYLWQHQLLADLRKLQNIALLVARFYIAQVFFLSGLTKIVNWNNTLYLFQNEYKVPFLPSELAAWLGTSGELILPVFLIMGLLGRFSAIGLFVVNLMAAVSLVEIAPAALSQHMLWGSLLVALTILGAGRISLDSWLKQWAHKTLGCD